jgi:ankyrin repeat protein
MKQLFTLILVILFTPEASGQTIDIKQLPPQDILDLGVLFGNLELVKSAIAKGADINYNELDKQFPLCNAIYGANPPPGEDGKTYVEMLASGFGITIPPRSKYIEIIRWLIQNGADPTNVGHMDEGIPLIRAAEYRDIEIVRLLLDLKADPNSKTENGATALHTLAYPSPFPYPYRSAPEIAKLLISKGAKMTKTSLTGETPLASVKEMLRIIEDSASPWRDYPFYNELVNSLKSLIDFYNKL